MTAPALPVTGPTAPGPISVRAATNVRLVSGKITQVQTLAEAEYYCESRDAYLKQTKFTENTDLKDLDRLLVLELMTFRWQQHLFAGYDYDGDMVNEKQLTADIKLYSDQINKIKESMGLNKKSRDDAANEGNFSQWFTELKARARIFGIHREHQLTRALVLLQELFTVINAYDRSDEEERRKLGFENDSEIVAWVRDTMQPEYRQIDEYFRAHEQRYWVRDL